MFPNCDLVGILTRIQAGAHERHFPGLEYIAEAALNIIRDSHDNYLADYDAHTLADLIREIHQTGCCGEEILDNLFAGTQDCAICKAVAEKFTAA